MQQGVKHAAPFSLDSNMMTSSVKRWCWRAKCFRMWGHFTPHFTKFRQSKFWLVSLRHESDSKLTIASKVSDGQRPGQLQLMVVRWYPGQDPLEDAALSSLKQLLHGLVCTKTGNKSNRTAIFQSSYQPRVTVGLLMCEEDCRERKDDAWSHRHVASGL